MKSKHERKYYIDHEALQSIGARIREHRNRKEISLETLANESEIDYSQLSRMELGKVNFGISYLFRIARALELDPKELL